MKKEKKRGRKKAETETETETETKIPPPRSDMFRCFRGKIDWHRKHSISRYKSYIYLDLSAITSIIFPRRALANLLMARDLRFCRNRLKFLSFVVCLSLKRHAAVSLAIAPILIRRNIRRIDDRCGDRCNIDGEILIIPEILLISYRSDVAA